MWGYLYPIGLGGILSIPQLIALVPKDSIDPLSLLAELRLPLPSLLVLYILLLLPLIYY